VAAVVPTYRPEGTALTSTVERLVESQVPVIVVDDGSPCAFDATLRSIRQQCTRVVRHHENAGIARSLNDGLRFADELGARWLLTVDQDSALAAGYIDALLGFLARAEAALGPGSVGAIAAGSIADASGQLDYPVRQERGIPVTHEVIQTGTLWSVDALSEAGGFDESLGIDAVDAAACLALRRAGKHIAVAPDVEVVHRIGQGRQVSVLGRSVLSSGHSPERRTTMVRNRLRLFPGEFVMSPSHALRTLRRVAVNTALAVTIEDDRWAKAKGAARGLLPRSKR
jgi:rhamnosyltransferase